MPAAALTWNTLYAAASYGQYLHTVHSQTRSHAQNQYICICGCSYVCIVCAYMYTHTHVFVCPSRQRVGHRRRRHDVRPGVAFASFWCVRGVCVCECVFESCCFIIDYGFEVVLAMTSSLHSLSVFHKFKLLIF